MTQPPSGEYVLFDTTVTGSGGRLSCTIAEEKKLPVGIYPVKLVVRYVTRQLNKQQKPTKLTRAFVLFLSFINIFTKY